jgi:hypothetical protein
MLFLIALVATHTALAEQNDLARSFDSPDGRFTLKMSLANKEAEEATLQVVEKASAKVVGDLGTDYASILSHPKVLWSRDSKRLAYRSAGRKEWSTSVAFWDGSAFKYVPLPEELPSPTIQFRKSDATGGVKNYGGGQEPLRWLKSGELELLGTERQMAHESSRTYTASMTITIGFDAQHHASVKAASKSKTRVE